jgi:hypothetical protein
LGAALIAVVVGALFLWHMRPRASVRDMRKAKLSDATNVVSGNAAWAIATKKDPRVREALARFQKIQGNDNREYYLVEGDNLLDEAGALLYVCEQLGIQTPARKAAVFESDGIANIFITGYASQGKPARWANTNLSYCIVSNTFTTAHYTIVASNLLKAAAAWNSAATGNVTFVYRQEFDFRNLRLDPDTGSPEDVTFVVEACRLNPNVVAAAFFPTDPGYRRRLWVAPSYFAPTLVYDPVGVFRHELGHILGFVHEQLESPFPGVCPKENPPPGPTRPFGTYDSKSVMHYLCGNVGSPKLELTEGDISGIRKLYDRPVNRVDLLR